MRDGARLATRRPCEPAVFGRRCSVARRASEEGRRFPSKESPDFLIAVDPSPFGARAPRKRGLPKFSAGPSSDGQNLRKKKLRCRPCRRPSCSACARLLAQRIAYYIVRTVAFAESSCSYRHIPESRQLSRHSETIRLTKILFHTQSIQNVSCTHFPAVDK